MVKPIIAIDGPAASGKGTLARRLAECLNFAYLDTGAVYRLVALKVIETGLDPVIAVGEVEKFFQLNQLDNDNLRRDDVGSMTSKIAAIPDVRLVLDELQKNFAYHPPAPFNGAVLDGRDIGTHITPDASLKFYVTSRPEIRAQRRFKELQLKGIPVSYEAVLKDMIERDTRDQTREFRPLKPADDAILLDTSDMTIDEVLEKALDIARTRFA
jgi:CMP/dCMP kinase